MNTNIENTDGAFKAHDDSRVKQAVEIVRKTCRLPINPTAKLVGYVMRTTRIFDSRQLAEITGLSIRVIQKSKNDYVAALDEAGELGFAERSEPGESSEPGFANPTNPANQDSLPREHTHARIELPSGVLPLQEVKKDTPQPPKGPGKAECLQAFELYNETALRCAIPQAAKFTPERQRKIAARLKVYGMAGWKQALANIEKSSFLTGGTDHNFRADLDFMLQDKSFGRLHDGGYGNGRHAKVSPPVRKVYDQFAEQAARRAMAEQMMREDGLLS
jgi:hypothetical protein